MTSRTLTIDSDRLRPCSSRLPGNPSQPRPHPQDGKDDTPPSGTRGQDHR